jgi:hypothetical protein
MIATQEMGKGAAKDIWRILIKFQEIAFAVNGGS